MNPPLDPIAETDLQAYVENQLPVTRRIEVETYLSRHPEEAMRVMADLRLRDELRLAFADDPFTHRADIQGAARRLDRALGRIRLMRRLRRLAASIALIGFGWFAHAQVEQANGLDVSASTLPPAYVTDAVMAHRTSLLRAIMRSQPESPDYDPGEIRRATDIELPTLPGDWTIIDVQIFPSSLGPSVEMALDTDRFGHLSLFAVQSRASATVPATVTQQDDATAVYWQRGSVAYVLVTQTAASGIDEAAALLSTTF